MQDIVHVKGICPTAFFAYTTEKRKPDVEAAPRHHACPQILRSGNFPHIKSIIIFALEKKKSVQSLNWNLISNWLLL